MFSNNPKVASFYPTNKSSNTNFYNQLSANTTMTNSFGANNSMLFTNNQPINYQNKSISDSVELALITVNLSYSKFKSMDKEELDNHIKVAAYNNGYESKKFLLALNILNAEIDKTQHNIIKQQSPQNNKSYVDTQENKINMSEVICVEPDEFNLDTHMSNSDNSTNYTYESRSQPISFVNNINNTNTFNPNQKFIIKQNKNLDMSTYSGNPMGIFKITNSQPVNSVRPINQFHKNNFEVVTQQDNMSNTSNTSNVSNMTNMTNMTAPTHLFNSNSDFSSQHNYTSAMNNNQSSNINNNIIRQTSTLSNPLMFQGNGGRKRTSNMDISSSNNFVTIK